MAVSNARNTQQVIEALTEGTSEARNTQQVIEALTEGTSEARMTQQVIEVLMKTGNWSRLTQQYLEVLTNAPINRSASDTITITEDNEYTVDSAGAPVDRDADDTITITEDNERLRIVTRSFGDTLTITESNERELLCFRAASDNITITESNSFDISQTSGVEDEITITEDNEYLIVPMWFGQDTIEFTESYERQIVFYREAHDIVDITETNRRRFAYTRDAKDTLVPTDKAFGERHDAGDSDLITITESTTSERIIYRSGADLITFTESYATAKTFDRSATDTITILDNIPLFIEGLYVTVPAYVGTVVYNSCENRSRTFCVLSGMHSSVALPNPLFGDVEANTDQLRVFRTTTNRRVVSVKRQQLRTLVYTFRLTRKKAIELQNLIKLEIDNQVTWRNWKGETWVGTIGTNPFITTADGRWGPCTEGMTVELELKAVRVV